LIIPLHDGYTWHMMSEG